MNWPERGLDTPLNTVPRWHIAWGTGHRIVEQTIARLQAHPHRSRLEILFDCEVAELDVAGGRVSGVRGRSLVDVSIFAARAGARTIAGG